MCELTILMPCLNESRTLANCIRKAQGFLDARKVDGEILIADNGSTDDSVEIALGLGARVIIEEKKGYGAALISGIQKARGKFVIMGDADESYDFSPLDQFLDKLREGYDLVMGNRFSGEIKDGAMPTLHKYLGNPVLSFLCRKFFGSKIGDFNSGLRGFNKQKILDLHLTTPGMEFAPEMVVKATIHHYRITEIPITLYPDGRSRAPHLKTWRDGWRQLVFLLIFSPKWLFFIPSLIIFGISLAALIALLPGTIYFPGFGLDIHTFTVAGFMAVLSYQLFLFALFVRIFSINQGLYPAKEKHVRFISLFTLERGILTGALLFLTGLAFFLLLFIFWAGIDFGHIDNISSTFRLLIPSLVLISLGIETIFASFFIRIMSIGQKIKLFHETH